MSDMTLMEEMLEASISNIDPADHERRWARYKWLIERHEKKLIAKEREACAKVADKYLGVGPKAIAAEIRARKDESERDEARKELDAIDPDWRKHCREWKP
jgi:hypothetical protein